MTSSNIALTEAMSNQQDMAAAPVIEIDGSTGSIFDHHRDGWSILVKERDEVIFVADGFMTLGGNPGFYFSYPADLAG